MIQQGNLYEMNETGRKTYRVPFEDRFGVLEIYTPENDYLKISNPKWKFTAIHGTSAMLTDLFESNTSNNVNNDIKKLADVFEFVEFEGITSDGKMISVKVSEVWE